MNSLAALAALFLAAFFPAAPLAAQAEKPAPQQTTEPTTQGAPPVIPRPRRPPNPMLSHDIPPEKRGDLSDCASRDKRSIEFVAKNCWPVLQAYKTLIRLRGASKSAIAKQERQAPDAIATKNRALSLANQLHSQHVGGRWPMQNYVAQSGYQPLIAMLKAFGDHEAALAAHDDYIALQGRTLMNNPTFLRGYLYKDKSEYLLELGRRDEALANFTAATALADREPIDMISNVEHAELIAYDAIIAKDEDRALGAINMFLDKTERHSRHQDLVYYPIRILKIYILAGRKDYDGVLAELKTFNSLSRRNLCQHDKPIEFYFPQVVSPTQSDPRIAAELKDFGCSEAIIAGLDDNMADGVPASEGVKPLPPR
ncbi:hypothetical protein [Parasphingorhabdus cellanae]|uniref:Tetratricopeptide repeat protein n=1 Tax=Parasphingorhabdus cellanae TaxID=2806553 RepID=A0ABX7T9M6_9SPHN|nr:hypothetical protein [Parasphingorhabdus cellanae]QTD57562.1 hypothetical protein J4G78_08605 [Parasphingorhabdus cellanae]